jgi:hypothetical protein
METAGPVVTPSPTLFQNNPTDSIAPAFEGTVLVSFYLDGTSSVFRKALAMDLSMAPEDISVSYMSLKSIEYIVRIRAHDLQRTMALLNMASKNTNSVLTNAVGPFQIRDMQVEKVAGDGNSNNLPTISPEVPTPAVLAPKTTTVVHPHASGATTAVQSTLLSLAVAAFCLLLTAL